MASLAAYRMVGSSAPICEEAGAIWVAASQRTAKNPL